MKEGKSEIAAREARGPRPLMIKKQQSIDDDLAEQSVALETNRTALQVGSEDEHAQTQDVLKSIQKASEGITKIAAPKLNLRTVKNKKASKQILEMTGGASVLEQTNLTSRGPPQSEQTETYYGENSEMLSTSQTAQKQ